jgi:hypothetical protein
MFRPRSRSRSRSFDYNYDFQRRRSPPPPHLHSRLPRRAWERSRSRSPPPPPKSSVLCKYFSRPTGCDKGNRCRFRHERPRSRSFSPSRSRSRSPPRSPRSRSPPLRYRRGESPMLIPRGGLRSPQPSLLQRLGPVAPMRPVSPMRSRAVSNDPTEPLEEGEERSPGRKAGKSRGRGRRRLDRNRDKGNWDSFVAEEDDYMSEDEGRGSKRGYESRRGEYFCFSGDLLPTLASGNSARVCCSCRDLDAQHFYYYSLNNTGRSRSRSPRVGIRSLSRSRSRSAQNVTTVSTRSSSKEKRSLRPAAYPPTRSRSRSRSRSARLRSPTPSPEQTPSHGRSRTRSQSHSLSRQSRSRSRSPYRQPRHDHDREHLVEHEKSSTSTSNPSSSVATANPASSSIPTGPRWRAGATPQAATVPVARVVPASGRGGPPPTGPRGDREPPRGPRNMVTSSVNMGVGAGSIMASSGPGWERPQLAFQNYLAAVQSKLEEREGKKKDEELAPDDESKIAVEARTTSVQAESDAMDVDAPEERSAGRSHSNTPIPVPSIDGSHVASPAYTNARQASASLHASPVVGQEVPLPASQSYVPAPSTIHPSLSLPQTHPLPLPPRPRSPPRGPRATRGLPEKPKGVSLDLGREGVAERDRVMDTVEQGRDRNDWIGKDRPGGEAERKTHVLSANSVRRPRMPPVRATKRESLFPDLEKEVSSRFPDLVGLDSFPWSSVSRTKLFENNPGSISSHIAAPFTTCFLNFKEASPWMEG